MNLFENLNRKCAILFDYLCLFVVVFVVFESFLAFEFVEYHPIIVGLIAVGMTVLFRYLLRNRFTLGEIIFQVNEREKKYYRFMQKVEDNTPLSRVSDVHTSDKAGFTLLVMLMMLIVVGCGTWLFVVWII